MKIIGQILEESCFWPVTGCDQTAADARTLLLLALLKF